MPSTLLTFCVPRALIVRALAEASCAFFNAALRAAVILKAARRLILPALVLRPMAATDAPVTRLAAPYAFLRILARAVFLVLFAPILSRSFCVFDLAIIISSSLF